MLLDKVLILQRIITKDVCLLSSDFLTPFDPTHQFEHVSS